MWIRFKIVIKCRHRKYPRRSQRKEKGRGGGEGERELNKVLKNQIKIIIKKRRRKRSCTRTPSITFKSAKSEPFHRNERSAMTFISPKGLQLNDRDCSRLTSFWGPGGEGGCVGGGKKCLCAGVDTTESHLEMTFSYFCNRSIIPRGKREGTVLWGEVI